MRKRRYALAAALGLAVTAFWTVKTENYEFLHLDDPDFVLSNPSVKAGLSPKGLVWCFTNITEDQYWHPLTWASLMADASISSGTTESMSRVMHRHNALLQGLSAALLLLLMLRLLGDPLRKGDIVLSAILTLIWAIHPLRAEAVCWVTERKEVLCAAFSLATVLLWLREGPLAKAAAIMACACALLSKSVAVTLPAVLVALDFIRSGAFWRTVRARWPLWAPLFALSGATAVLTVLTQQPAVAGNLEEATFLIKLFNGFGAYAVHFTRVIRPVDLFVSRPFVNHVDWRMFMPGLIIVGTMLYATYRFFRDGMRPRSVSAVGFLAAAWIGAGLLPMCGILRVGIEMNPDRFGHWIGTGLVTVAALLLSRISAKPLRIPACALLGAASVAYSVMAWRYAETFRNNYLFYMNTISRWPEHAAALGQLGCEYAMRFHDPDTAIRLSEESMAIQMSEDVAGQLVNLLAERGRPEDCERVKELTSAVIANHSLDERGGALTALGIVAMREEKWDEALDYLKDSNVRRKANAIPIDDNELRIAICLSKKRETENAALIFRKLAQSAPNPSVRRKAAEELKKLPSATDAGQQKLGPRN